MGAGQGVGEHFKEAGALCASPGLVLALWLWISHLSSFCFFAYKIKGLDQDRDSVVYSSRFHSRREDIVKQPQEKRRGVCLYCGTMLEVDFQEF